MATKKRASRLITIGGPVGLFLGFFFGNLAFNGSLVAEALPFIKPIGQLWMNGLRVAVVPLTVCLLVSGVCALPKGKELGAWGAKTLAWFAALLVLGAVFTVAASEVYFALDPPKPLAIETTTSLDQEEKDGNWVDSLIPTNAVDAAAKGDILPLAILSVFFGLALRTLPDERRRPVEGFFVGVRDASLVFVHWLILAIPIGAFALTFSFAAESGLATAAVLLQFTVFVTVLISLALIGVLAAIYLSAKRSAREVTEAVSPLLSVAIGTRSSLASLPTLVESANQLRLPDPAAEIVLPTAVSVFKMNRTISAVGKLLFVSAALGLVVAPQVLIVFIGTIVLLSFATPGLPAGGSNASWGAYMAAGLPIEAIVFFEVTDGITDIAKTALNVVADFAVAVFVSRSAMELSTQPTISIEPHFPTP